MCNMPLSDQCGTYFPLPVVIQGKADYGEWFVFHLPKKPLPEVSMEGIVRRTLGRPDQIAAIEGGKGPVFIIGKADADGAVINRLLQNAADIQNSPSIAVDAAVTATVFDQGQMLIKTASGPPGPGIGQGVRDRPVPAGIGWNAGIAFQKILQALHVGIDDPMVNPVEPKRSGKLRQSCRRLPRSDERRMDEENARGVTRC